MLVIAEDIKSKIQISLLILKWLRKQKKKY